MPVPARFGRAAGTWGTDRTGRRGWAHCTPAVVAGHSGPGNRRPGVHFAAYARLFALQASGYRDGIPGA
ncbi:hypothetical protein GCM10010106_27280 [Thermopolyspora flexuosa]|nr:hypothetical protein GCM10010106_27280 [Thermopolyspora flexuosa]